MKSNIAFISPEERLFQVIKGGVVSTHGREIEVKPHVSLFSYLKGYKFYLFAVLFLIAVFSPCYYFLSAGLNKKNTTLKSGGAFDSVELIPQVKDTQVEDTQVKDTQVKDAQVKDAQVKDVVTIPVKESEPAEKVVLTRDLVKNLYLVGIAWGDEPRAMVENKESGKTFFLRRGDLFYQFRVGKILIDRVVLECKGERFELM